MSYNNPNLPIKILITYNDLFTYFNANIDNVEDEILLSDVVFVDIVWENTGDDNIMVDWVCDDIGDGGELEAKHTSELMNLIIENEYVEESEESEEDGEVEIYIRDDDETLSLESESSDSETSYSEDEEILDLG